MKNLLVSIILFSFLCACSNKYLRPDPLETKRVPVDNCALIHKQEEKAQQLQATQSQINQYRFKGDFSELPISKVDFTEGPEMVEVERVEVVQENIYSLPELAQENKINKKKTAQKSSEETQKPFPDLSKTPEKKITSKQQYHKHINKKKRQIKEMEQNSKSTKTPSTKSHEVSNTSTKANPVATKEDVQKKLNQLGGIKDLNTNAVAAPASSVPINNSPAIVENPAQSPNVPNNSLATNPAPSSASVNTSSAPIEQPVTAPIVAQAPAPQATPTTTAIQDTNSAAGIPPAPAIPNSFAITNSSVPNTIQPITPPMSKIGKKKITINTDNTVQLKDTNPVGAASNSDNSGPLPQLPPLPN
jgi:hypothetical protein